MVISRFKEVEISLTCFLILSIAFWISLFIISPSYVEFALTKSEVEKRLVPEDRKVYVYEYTPKDLLKTYQHIKQVESTQNVVKLAVLIYGIIGMLIFFSFERKILHKIYLPLILIIFISIFITSHIYYNFIFGPFTDKFNDPYPICRTQLS